MIKVTQLFLTLLLIIPTFLISQETTHTFKGKVYAYNEGLKDAKIEVFQGGELVYETSSNGGGKFEFKLEAEQQYTVEVSADNFAKKIIWINTKNTESVKSKIPTFAFDVHLKKEKKNDTIELSEIPVTLIKYQPKKNEFYMDKTYEELIKSKKKKIKDSKLKDR